MNRIDFIHPRLVKSTLQKFKGGGSVVASEPGLDEAMSEIRSTLKMDLPTATKNDLQKQLDRLELESQQGSLFDESTIEDIEHGNPYSIEMLSNGKFFELNNTKVLGTIKIAQSMHGKEIRIVEGDISNLDQIKISDNFAQFVKNQDYAVTSVKPSIQEQGQDPDNESFIDNIIDESKKTVVRKKEIQAKPIVQQEIDKSKIQTTEEVYRKLNKKISLEELKAYLWYKDDIGQGFSDEWYKIAGLDGHTKFAPSTVTKWAKDGILCYFKGQLIPKALYLSGDLYEKISRLVKAGANSGQDIHPITELVGEDALNRQIEECNRVYEEVYSSRLIITGNKDNNSLILKPIDKICRNTMVKELVDYDEMKWYGSKPKWDKTTGRHKTVYEELSITDAFCFYLVSESLQLDIKGGVTYLDIIELYIMGKKRHAPKGLDDINKAKWKVNYLRSKSKSKEEGDKLFLKFLNDQLIPKDRVSLEMYWNRQFNNFVQPDYEKIPVAFNVAREFFGEDPFIIKPEKREAVSFLLNEGSGCLAYDVGVGKTMCAIMIAEQFIVAGYCKRPFIVVPNQTYKQWLSEIKNVLPHRHINDFGNLRKKYLKSASTINDEGEEVANLVQENSITVLTYEGFEMLGFKEQTKSDLMFELYDILNQADDDTIENPKRVGAFRERLEGIVGKGLKGGHLNIEDFGFDFVCYDEAHALKKVFTSAKAEVTKKGKRGRKEYQMTSGNPSSVGLRGFMLSHYILKNNNYRNVLLLTATPFTNSPLEVFSMLSLVAYKKLKDQKLNNINDFFDNYIDTSTELTINHKYQPQYKQVVKGYNNLPSLQKVIFRFFNYKTGEDVGVVRPNKYVLPYAKKLVDNQIIKLPSDEQVLSYLEPSHHQKMYMDLIIAYAENKIDYSGMTVLMDHESADADDDVDNSDETPAEVVDIDALDTDGRDKARAIISMNFMRDTALSPYLFKFNNLGTPNYKDFVEQSPKVLYTIKCIETVKKYHEQHGQEVSGQVIYADRGVRFFPLIIEYLVKEIGYKEHEIGMITGEMKIEQRKIVQDSFLGRKYDEKEKDFVKISDDERIKVLLGSSSIKEGMNLQKKTTCLYNLFIDWNPTDNLQLSGRIWRQGNQYKNVRIINPLMIDSSDVFMFQKLEEKTARINTIWSNDGRSALRLDEFNPEELKNDLIKDPNVLAQIRILKGKLKIKDDIQFNEGLSQRLDDYLSAKNSIESETEWLSDKWDQYHQKQSKKPTTAEDLLVAIRKLDALKTLKDSEGNPMLSRWESERMSWSERNEQSISPHWRPSPDRWRLPGMYINLRLLVKERRDLLSPRGIQDNKDDILESKLDIETTNKELEKEVELLESKDYSETLAREIEADRLKQKIQEKTIEENVIDFEKLNYLLNFKYCNIKASIPEPQEDNLKELVEQGLKDLKLLVDITDGELKTNIVEAIKDLEQIREFA